MNSKWGKGSTKAKTTQCAHGKVSVAGVISVRRGQGCLLWTQLQQSNHRAWLRLSAKLVMSLKTCLRKGRKHQRGRGENNSRSKEEVLHGWTGTHGWDHNLWMHTTVGLRLEHRTGESRKEWQRDTWSRPQATLHWRDWGYPEAVTRVGGDVLGAKLNLRRREDRCFNYSTSLFISQYLNQ